MLDYSDEELRGKTFQDLTPEKWHEIEARVVAGQVLPRGFSEVYEKECRRRNGTVFPVELRAFLIRDDAGQPVGMWAIIRDITERKQFEKALQERETRFRQLVELLPVAIYSCDNSSRIVHFNQATGRPLGERANRWEVSRTILWVL